MTPHKKGLEAISDRQVSSNFELTIIFKKFEADEDGDAYVVAECLEIPGCISQGSTDDEARQNIQEAVKACLNVMLEDCVKHATANHRAPDLRGTTSQQILTVASMPHLHYA